MRANSSDERSTPPRRHRFLVIVLFVLVHALDVSSADLYEPTAGSLDQPDPKTNSSQKFECTGNHETVHHVFTWPDYTVLALMLLVSCGIGLFYGFLSSQQNTGDDFLLGGCSMGTLPMAMSLAAGFITAIELLGNPAEMYNHGSQFWMICLSFVFVVPITSRFYLPVFMNLRLTSSYEYLSMRFSKQTRIFASALYVLQMMMYTSVAVYAPALALSHVTGLNVYVAVTVVYLVCIFYASQGGMKAVIMTDTFQAAVLVGSILVVMHLGEKFVGGTEAIWSTNYLSNRLELWNMDPSLTVRHSFWSVVIGGTFYWLTMFCSNQASIQKYLSVENISQVRSALWISCISLILIYTVNFYTGMILFAEYHKCDPLLSNAITAKDEILPLYVMNEMGHLRGVPGFFVAGIFAASLGTVASALNSLAAVTLKDFFAELGGLEIAHDKEAIWAKWISLVFGALSFTLVFVVERLGSVMQVAISFNGMAGGVTLGLFSIGMFFPWANSKGAIFGSAISMALVTWMGFGQQVLSILGKFHDEQKPLSTLECHCMNETLKVNYDEIIDQNGDVFFLYRISYIWYSTIGCLGTVIFGLIISAITGFKNPQDVKEELLSPPVKHLLTILPNWMKEKLNIPLKSNYSRDVQMNGVVNLGLDLNMDKVLAERKLRKISAPA